MYVGGSVVVGKSTAVAMSLAAAILLVSCASAESGVESATDAGGVGEAIQESGADQPADAAPRGFEFASGFLEFGDFDPYTLGDGIFNPCTEITEEEFAAAGFSNKRHQTKPDALSDGMTSCYFGEIRDDGVVRGFSNGTINRVVAEERDLVIHGYTSELLPEMYVLKPRRDNGASCFTQIDTVRGGFGTQVAGPRGRITTDEACALAINDLEALYVRYGEPTEPA